MSNLLELTCAERDRVRQKVSEFKAAKEAAEKQLEYWTHQERAITVVALRLEMERAQKENLETDQSR